jgi:hypothetical protein
MNDFDRYIIETLADVGFSHRYIASYISGKPLEKCTKREIGAVRYVCYKKAGILITNWRNGKTPAAKQFVKQAIKKRRQQKAG